MSRGDTLLVCNLDRHGVGLIMLSMGGQGIDTGAAAVAAGCVPGYDSLHSVIDLPQLSTAA